jgi:hypothetical protein
MTEQELEQALRRALRPVDPGEQFGARVAARLAGEAGDAGGRAGGQLPARQRTLTRWAPLALAACAITAVGVVRWHHQAFERQRALEARAQLLQALSIIGMNIDTVRVAVLRAEQPER